MRRELWLCAAAALAVRGWLTVAHRIDSDEPQHLHVIWGAARGLVQYRDVFDNHLPLLHLLFAPVMALTPEGPDVFLWMRIAIAPFAIACGWLLYLLAREPFGERAAATAAVVFSVMPPWLPKSVEFRNDTLWIFFWLAAMVLYTRRASLPAGIALGLALLASIKTAPLVLAHLLAAATERRTAEWKPALRLAAGGAIPVAAVTVWLLAHRALDDMVYAAFLFNTATPVDAARRIGGVVGFLVIAPPIVWAGRRSCHLTLFSLWYAVVLLCFWPIITPRDFLPLAPLAAIAIAVSLSRWRPAVLVALTIVAAIVYGRSWRGSDGSRERLVQAVTRMTAPGDYVFDLKGESVFRRRAVFPIYEDVGRALTENGTLSDTGPEDIVARGCCAAIADDEHIPDRTRAFLNRHFIGNGPLRVCGTSPSGNTFEIAVPQTYAVVAARPERVSIDGIPYRGPRLLRAGRHTVDRGENERVTIVWARAARETM